MQELDFLQMLGLAAQDLHSVPRELEAARQMMQSPRAPASAQFWKREERMTEQSLGAKCVFLGPQAEP